MLFTAVDPSNYSSGPLSILDIETGTTTALAPAAGNWSFGFSLDGSHVVFLDGQGDLDSVPVTGGTPVTLVPASQGKVENWLEPPDGSRVVAQVWPTGSRTRVLVTSPMGGGSMTTVATGVDANGISRSPDGRSFVFFSAPDYTTGNATLNLGDLTTGVTRAVMTGIALGRFQFTPDGSHVLFVDGQGHLQAVACAAGAAVDLGPVGANHLLLPSPDGTSVAVHTRAQPQDPTGTLELRSLAGGTPRVLSDAASLAPLGFAADGSQLVYEAVAPDGPGGPRPLLEMAPVAGGDPVPIVANPSNAWFFGDRMLVEADGVAPFERGFYVAPLK